MSSFVKTLQTTSTSTTGTNNVALLAEEIAEESWVIDQRYTWYDDYSDENYSYVDEMKNVSVNEKQINLTQESNSQFIPFVMPRRYDNFDLANTNILIHYENENGDGDFANPVNVQYSDTKIRFAWLVSKAVSAVEGEVKFEIQAVGANSKGDEYIFKSRPNGRLNILRSLSTTGVVEPDESWITSFLSKVTEQVAQANAAADLAKQYAEEANAAATRVESQIENVVKESMASALSDYYTKTEIDEMFANIDFTSVIEEVQQKIDAIDGLASFNSTYDSSTGLITFYNGETVMTQHTLMTNPTAEWTNSFRTSIREDIASSVGEVSNALDTYKTSNDQEVASLKEKTSALETDLADNHYTSTEVDEKINAKAAQLNSSISQVESTANANKSNIVAVTSKISELEEKMNGINTDPSLSYYATYDSATGQYTLYEVEGEIESVKSQFIISGGGGGGGTTSTTVVLDRITPSPITMTKNEKVIIKYNFSSVDTSGDDTGEGTATWKVGNSIVATSIAMQGENSFDVTDYVSLGTQKITLTVTDAAGTIAVKTWTVQIIDLYLESTFNDTYTYPIGTVSFDYIPYGAIEKVIHFILDGEEIGTVTTSASGIPMSYTIPAQTHGAHLLEVYATAEINNIVIETNHIYKDILWYDDTSTVPVIGCVYNNISVNQYDSMNITYVVYDPKTETPTVTLAIDGEDVSTLTLNQAVNIWQYKSSDVGEHSLTITCRDVVKTISIIVKALDIDIQPVTANLAFDFNPSGYSNNSENRLWVDSKNSDIAMTVSDNFDWVNGGYQLDENGDQYFCIKAGTTAEFSYNLFADDARKNGKEFKLVFRTANVRKSDAQFLTCQSGTTLVGLQMNVHEAYVKATGDSLYIPYSEEDIIEFEFNINKQEDIPLVLSYEDGVGCRPMLYTSDYSFTQTNPVPITIGSPDCDVYIYRMKAYSASLTDSGILSNFIADARNADEMIARYNRNQIYNENKQLTPESVADACPDLRVIKIDCPHFTNDKKDFVLNTNIECICRGGDQALDNWKAINAAHSGQGTTSNEYGQAGRNMDLLMCFDGEYRNSKITYDENYKTQITMGDGTVYKDGTGKITLSRNSVPTNYLNIKVKYLPLYTVMYIE